MKRIVSSLEFPQNPSCAAKTHSQRAVSKLQTWLCNDHSGAVTVDWVVIAAAVSGLGLAATTAVRTGSVAIGNDIETSLTGASVAQLGELGVGTLGKQCPADYEQTLIEAYNFDLVDLADDQALYSSYDTATLERDLASYSAPGGWGIENNEDNVQLILCELESRGVTSDVRAL